MGKMLRDMLTDGIIDLVYPRRCAGCGSRGGWLCPSCEAALPRLVPPWCDGCGVPTALAACACDDLAPALARVRSAFPYRGWIREAIVDFKYHDERARDVHLGAALSPLLDELPPVDALVPVPLHRGRQRRRGYNQAALLADQVAGATGLRVVGALERTRATPQQVSLGRMARQTNVAGAFAVSRAAAPEGRRLLLIDDVLTTGATLSACAEALVAAGAVWVGAITLARELPAVSPPTSGLPRSWRCGPRHRHW